ncbi:MAG: hypothetical protein H6824_01485 [Planctomycetaceae bacterium]|nr:hypothetical protein [Planctomycetaceae bacterium]
MPHRRLILVLAACVVLAAVGVALWFNLPVAEVVAIDPPDQRDQPSVDSFEPPSELGFVGSSACAECHAEIVGVYAQHPMAKSVRSVASDSEEWPEGFRSALVPGEHKVLTVQATPGAMTHEERIYDEEGELIAKCTYPMAYVVGAGERGRAYLRQQDNILFMSPVNWYPQESAWDLAPQYKKDDVRRFNRRVTADCLGCHTGRVAVTERGTNLYEPQVFHEMEIGCERCHGPGADHVAYQSGDELKSLATDPIVNPTKLTISQREAVCYQCHLSAIRVLQAGRSQLDFRPGMELSDVWCVLDEGTDIQADGRTKSVNHVQQMRDSRCFMGSNGEMGCISCHDPHSVPTVENRAEFFRSRCLNCHANEDCGEEMPKRMIVEDSCVDCHMPSLASHNMAHVAQTDHRVLKRPTDSLGDEGKDPAARGLVLFGEMRNQLSEAEQKRGLGLGSYVYLTRKGIPVPPQLTALLKDSLADYPNDGILLNALGTLSLKQNDVASALTFFERASHGLVEREVALDNLLRLSVLSQDSDATLEYAEQVLVIDSGDANAHASRALALRGLNRSVEAIAAMRKAIELNPGQLEYHDWLAGYFEALGQDENARAERTLIQRLQSARPPEDIENATGSNAGDG